MGQIGRDVLTGASVHDSQVAIPLSMRTSQRVTNLYDLMDAAYDAPEIRATSALLGHVPIIDINPRTAERKQEILEEERRLKLIRFTLPETLRFNERSTIERVNGRVKDDFGTRFVRVRGNQKVFCHQQFPLSLYSVDFRYYEKEKLGTEASSQNIKLNFECVGLQETQELLFSWEF